MKVTQEQFKSKYGGSLDALRNHAALMPSPEPKPRKKYEYLEFALQKQIAQYLEFKYPNVLFISNPINLNLTKAQRGMMAAINKKGFSCPDLILFEARRGFNGMLMELKKETPFTKDGLVKANTHIQAQAQWMGSLRRKGFYADFFWEFETARKAIDWYFREEVL